MSKKNLIFAIIILTLALALSACERSASEPPLASPTVGGEVEPTSSDPMQMLRSFATQTAIALSGGGQPAGGSTPVAPTVMQPVSGTQVLVTTPVAPTVTPISKTAVPANSTRPATYTLQDGEYPYCIARRFDVNPDDLLSMNGLSGGGLYVPGLVLKIPQTGSFPGARSLIPRPASYTVAAFDSIYKIACKYGDIDPIAIASANNLVAPYTLKTGQVITVP